VIGGGVAGIQAALDLADNGYDVTLVEKSPPSAGHGPAGQDLSHHGLLHLNLGPKMTDVGRHPRIKLFTLSEVVDVKGYVGNFEVKIVKKARYVDEKAAPPAATAPRSARWCGPMSSTWASPRARRSTRPFPRPCPRPT
jgi:heterodisulfide reductase subunit A2